MKKFIYLDVGDTLLHLKKPPYQVYESIFRKYGLIDNLLSSEQLLKEFRISMKDLNEKLDPEFRDRYAIHPQGQDGWWRDLIHLFLKRVGGKDESVPAGAYREIFSVFDDLNIWEIDSGFSDLLSFVERENIGLGIISNWDLRLRGLLGRMNLLQYFSHVIISAEFGYEKPSPKIFEEAQRLAGLDPSQMYYVGDKIELDYIPPRKMGWTSFLISREPQQELQHVFHLGEVSRFIF
jgi:2-haloacid dehalogenase